MNQSERRDSVRPRNGRQFQVLIIARISTVHQDARSLDDQVALCRRRVEELYTGPFEVTAITGQGSGEYLDRKELIEAEALVETRTLDLVVVEDLGRICRRNRAVDFCEACEDAGTRLIAINDHIDTADDNWRMSAFFASFKHESSNKDTSRRIRRSHRNRFTQGGVCTTFPYGYIKPSGAKSDADIRKDPAAERIYDEVFRRLENGHSYWEVADWLNAELVPMGRWARAMCWNGRRLAQVVHNTILKGVRRRNEKISKRINKTGRYRSIAAPVEERLYRHVPHLQFIEPDRYDRVIALLKVINARWARGKSPGTPDTRVGVARTRTRWPGQHAMCGVCGWRLFWGAHGQDTHMMCSGAFNYRCWNAASGDGILLAQRCADAVLRIVESMDDYDEALRERVATMARTTQAGRQTELDRIARESARLVREITNLTNAFAESGSSKALQDRLAAAEAQHANLAEERHQLEARTDQVADLPSLDDLRTAARRVFDRLDLQSPDAWRTLSTLVPRVTIYPYRLLGGRMVVWRAEIDIHVSALHGVVHPDVEQVLRRRVMIDVYDPPQFEAYRPEVIARRAAGQREWEIAEALGLTITAVQHAASLHRMMLAAGRTDPYVRLEAPTEDLGRVRRHRHQRFRFEPHPGYPARPQTEVE